ncbi:ABC transporter substrate-binding protein [Halalkalibacter lacteus]|uniref:ABC transporter substrate-binding protein n=1 Tax=Halalkalibacter lacteus TaxID=3090663 RepID=UPI002FC92C7B
MKKLLTIMVLVSLMFMALTACGSSEEGAGTSQGDVEVGEGELFIPIISKGFQHQFWQAVRKGAEKAGEEYGAVITFEGPESESNVDRQIDMLRSALDNKPDGIGFAALDSQASIPLLQQAQNNNIPIVAFDSGVESDIPISTAATDNKAASALAADKMAEFIDEEGKIALIVHDQTSITGVHRRDGFVEQIKAKYPNIEIVDIQYGGGDHLQSTDLAKAILLAYPDLKGLYGANEGSAIGVVNAVKELNKDGEVVVIGFDSGALQIEAIKSGVMAGAITQNPIGIGYETVKAAVKAAKGEPVEESIDTGFFWYDQNNIDDEEIQAVLYE